MTPLRPTLLTALAALMLAAFAGGCASPGSLEPNLVVTRADNDRLLSVELGQIIEVRLPENTSTDLRWDVDRVDAPILVPVGTAKEKPSAKEAGNATAVFKFRADKPGRGMIRLVYRRPWEQAMKGETLVILIQAH